MAGTSWWISRALVAALGASACWAGGPVEFGVEELNRAIAGRNFARQAIRYQTEVNTDPPESFRIERTRISGGDLRGLMYGLLEAAEQVRLTGHLAPTHGTPALAVRGVALRIELQDFEQDRFTSPEAWRRYFALLARNRFNRFHLIFSRSPLPYALDVPEYPEIHVPGLDPVRQVHNLQVLRMLSEAAAQHGIELVLGIPPGSMPPGVEGLTPDNFGPYTYMALKRLLAACPAIRGVQFHAGGEQPAQAGLLDWFYKAILETGRRVVLGVPAELADSARPAGLPFLLWDDYPEAGSPAPGAHPRCWSIDPTHRPEDPTPVLATLTRIGAEGFEIVPPPPPLDPAYPGYQRWGRLGFDPKAATTAPAPKARKRSSSARRRRVP